MLQNARGALGVPVTLRGQEGIRAAPGRAGDDGYLLVWTIKLGFRSRCCGLQHFETGGARGAATAALSYAILTWSGNLTFDHIWQALYFVGCGFILAEVLFGGAGAGGGDRCTSGCRTGRWRRDDLAARSLLAHGLAPKRAPQGCVLMRVLYLNAFSREVSGPDESLRTLLGQLVPMGVEAHVVLPVPGPQVERYRQLGAAVHIAPLAAIRRNLSPATAAYPIQLLVSAARVGGIARADRPDVIHTNMEAMLEGALAARATRIPHVLHYRGNTNDRAEVGVRCPDRDLDTRRPIKSTASRTRPPLCSRGARMDKVEVLYNPVDVARSRPRRDRMRCARRWARGAAVRLIGTVAAFTRARTSTPSCAPPPTSRAVPPTRISRSSGPRRGTSSTSTRPAARLGRRAGDRTPGHVRGRAP